MKPTAWDIFVIVTSLIGVAGYVVAFLALRNAHKRKLRNYKEELERRAKEYDEIYNQKMCDYKASLARRMRQCLENHRTKVQS